MDADTVREWSLAGAAASSALAAAGVGIRMFMGLPDWLDNRALARASAIERDAAMATLAVLLPQLTCIVAEMQPNGGNSLYDRVTHLVEWQEAHVSRHDRIEKAVDTAATTAAANSTKLGEVKVSLDRLSREIAQSA